MTFARSPSLRPLRAARVLTQLALVASPTLASFPLASFFPAASFPGATLRAQDVVTDGSGAPSDSSARVEQLVALLDKREGDQFWSLVSRLEGLGKEGVPALVARLSAASEKARLGCAKALLGLSAGDSASAAEQSGGAAVRSKALAALGELTRSARDPRVRADAIQVYGLAIESAQDDAEVDEVIERLEGLLETEMDPQVLIALCRTLWQADLLTSARDKLLALLESADPGVRDEAALALAESGNYAQGEVKDVLRRLRKEPSARGQRAELLYRLMKLERQQDEDILEKGRAPEDTDPAKLLERKEARIRELEAEVERLAGGARPGSGAAERSAKDSPEDRLLEEVISKVEKQYVDPEKAVRSRLLVNAVKGMVHALDEHSLFMEEEQSKDFDADIKGEYPGIGAHISKRSEGPLEIVRPIYGGPAYKEGLVSGDLILEIDGRSTHELKLEELKEVLRGPQGTTVTLKVIRRGWTEPKDFKLVRQQIELSSVFHESLPEKLGYLRLTQFGERSAEEFRKALDELEAQGLEGLIIDLRNNPGGYLPRAEEIADLFVAGELPIVTQKGRDGEGEKSAMPDSAARTGYAIVVLVNEHSASASEVVAGCLQDHRRAALVGKRTFGKGSVQRLVAIDSKPGCTLKLTVQYWYLPLGRCIDTLRDERGRVIRQGGVEPDVEVDPEALPAWRIEERSALRTDERIAAYVDSHFEALKGLVPLGDRGDPALYPEFDALYTSLGTHALPEDVRQVVRYHLRRRLEDARGREFAFDLQEDVQLQRAVLELLERIGRKPAESAAYGWLTRLSSAKAPPASTEG